MRAVITGGAGFIGSHLAKLLIKEGHETIVLDDLSTGRLDNIAPAGIQYIDVDLRDYENLNMVFDELMRFGQIDYIFHLAAKASIVPSIKDPQLYHDVNVGGTLNILEMARKYEVKKIIYAASGSCYGIPEKIPTSENCPINPMYPYALTKYIAEQYIQHWSKVYGLPFISLRLFNVFGPRMCLSGGYGGFFSGVLPQVFNNQPVVTIGDGSQRRDFVYVEDVAKAFLAAAESQVKNEIFNIGKGVSYSINTIFEFLEIKNKDIFRLSPRPGEPFETKADIRKAIEYLDWEPHFGFCQGLMETIKDEDYWKSGRVWTYYESLKAQEDWYQYLGHNKQT